MNLKALVLVVAMGLSVTACGPRKPAYSDINTNQPARPEAPAATSEPAQSPAGGAAPTAPAQPPPAPPTAFRMPAFMDAAKGYPKDLPNYPQAATVNVQYGPSGDFDTYSVSLRTGDPMEKIAGFYDQMVKSNGWTVSSRLIDPEFAEWVLKKSDSDEGKVTVQKEKKGNTFIIVTARAGKPPQKPQAAPAPKS